jgi:hypothetical protein
VKRLTFEDPADARAWLEGLRVSFEDIDAVVADMLAPMRKRRLGHATHAEHYNAAKEQIRSALAYAPPEPEHGDPAGLGGGGGGE